MNKDLIEQCAYNMFEYEYTNKGWDAEWCKEAFAVESIRGNFVTLATIAYNTFEDNQAHDVQIPEIVTKVNDDVWIEKVGDEYRVEVWCAFSFDWVTFEVFNNLDDAIAWANIPENVK